MHFSQYLRDNLGRLVHLPPSELEEALMTAFAEAERERAFNEAAKLVCADCKCGKPLTTDGELDLRHYILDQNGYTKILTSHCVAADIHELRRENYDTTKK